MLWDKGKLTNTEAMKALFEAAAVKDSDMDHLEQVYAELAAMEREGETK